MRSDEAIEEASRRLTLLTAHKSLVDQTEQWALNQGCIHFWLDFEMNADFTGDKPRLLALLRELGRLGWRRKHDPYIQDNRVAIRLCRSPATINLRLSYTSTTCQMVETGEFETIRKPKLRMECNETFTMETFTSQETDLLPNTAN